MPTKLLGPCRHPGCPRRGTHQGYCDQHAGDAKHYDQQRGTAASRGYNSQWTKLRDLKLMRDPLCEDCASLGHVTVATIVHHANPISEGGAVLPPLNELVSLCAACHAKRHAR